MKLRLSEECGIYTKFYVLHFFVWADLWPYCNAYVRPVTRAMWEREISQKGVTSTNKRNGHMLINLSKRDPDRNGRRKTTLTC